MTQTVSIGKTLILVFISSVLGQLVTQGSSIFDVGSGEWKGIAGAAIAAVLTFAYNYLIPQDTRYGVGARSK